MKYYVLSERGYYHEVNAHSLDGVIAFCRERYGKDKVITDTFRSPYMAGRRFAGLSEVPFAVLETQPSNHDQDPNCLKENRE